MKHNIYLVGMGPGKEEMMTGEALKALEAADVIIGYTVYIKLLGERFADKEMRTTPMRQEEERCKLCFEEAKKGKQVAMVCSGNRDLRNGIVTVRNGKRISGYRDFCHTGDNGGLQRGGSFGAPLNHDFCVISLSDLLTPWEKIEKRLLAAAGGDFAIAIYNPSSHKRKDYLKKACDILLRVIEEERPCGYVENIGREGTKAVTCTLRELRDTQVNMFTTVFIGNSDTELIHGKLVTKRGYHIERNTDIK